MKFKKIINEFTAVEFGDGKVTKKITGDKATEKMILNKVIEAFNSSKELQRVIGVISDDKLDISIDTKSSTYVIKFQPEDESMKPYVATYPKSYIEKYLNMEPKLFASLLMRVGI